jgi:GT2 family glycosyltransferase
LSDLAVVILTRGDRDRELAAAVQSVVRQEGVEAGLVVVANGCNLEPPPPGVTVVTIGENVGIPAGRNLGWRAAGAEFVLFLDDDAVLGSADVAGRALEAFRDDERLGVISMCIRDEGGEVQRRHVPRLRVGDPARSSDVTTFLGGACIVRRSVLEETGGFPDEFFYALEESDLAWAVLDLGYRVRYRGDLEVLHPATPVTRHDRALYYGARNRVLLARRRLPLILGVAHVLLRAVLGLRQVRRVGHLGAMARGYVDGMRHPISDRRPIRWSTAWRMTRLGRPPVI